MFTVPARLAGPPWAGRSLTRGHSPGQAILSKCSVTQVWSLFLPDTTARALWGPMGVPRGTVGLPGYCGHVGTV